MSRFVSGVLDDFQEECHLDMLHDNMDISHLIVHSQQMEDTSPKRKSRDAKRTRSLMVVLQTVSLTSKISLDSRRDF